MINTKHNVPVCADPVDPESLYMRNLYHEFFWGPFKDEQAVIDAVKVLDKADEYWDYDPFCVIHGASPLPDNYVTGFGFVDDCVKDRIMDAR